VERSGKVMDEIAKSRLKEREKLVVEAFYERSIPKS
jgi:hypothetical protein